MLSRISSLLGPGHAAAIGNLSTGRELGQSVERILRNWWSSERPLGRTYALVNIVVGAVFLALAALDVDLGLGSYARWLFLLPFGGIPLVCGLLALRFGADGTTARPIRLAGDLGLWALMSLFSVLALLRDDPEYGPLLTLLAFLIVTVASAVVNARKK